MKSFREFIEEGDVACNAVGGGINLAGLGVGPNGEPGVPKKRKKKTPVIEPMNRRMSDGTTQKRR